MEITKVYPMDAVYDSLDDVPEDVMIAFNQFSYTIRIIFYFCLHFLLVGLCR
jgi:hypothetical protein